LILIFTIQTFGAFSSFSAVRFACGQLFIATPTMRSLNPRIGLEPVDITHVSSRVSCRDCGSLQSTTEKRYAVSVIIYLCYWWTNIR